MTADIFFLNKTNECKTSSSPFLHMKRSLAFVDASLNQKIRMAKVIAPLLADKNSNHEHLAVISRDEPLEDKVIAVIMLGFPENRAMLPTLSGLLSAQEESLRIAASIAISQMKNGKNDKILHEILLSACEQERSPSVKLCLKKAMNFLNKASRTLLQRLS